MQIKKTLILPAPETNFDRSLEVVLSDYTRELSAMLNGGLKFSDNFNAAIVQVANTGSAGVQFTVAHNLSRVPVGFLVIRNSAAGYVYESGTAWTTSNIYLKHSAAAAAVTVLVF